MYNLGTYDILYQQFNNVRLRNSAVLIITMNGTAAEVSKNIVLAGVATLVVQDHRPVDRYHLNSQFFVTEADVDKNVF